MTEVKQSLFAREVNDALGRSPLTPEEVVHKLHSTGYFVDIKNFNKWRQGESLPRDVQAFRIAACLEDILNVQRGKLCEDLLYDLFPVKSFIVDEHIIPELVAFPSESNSDDCEDSYSLTENTDWIIDAHRLVVKDEIRVSADYKTILWNTIIGSLVPPVPRPSIEFAVVLGKNELPYQGKFIFDVRGAYIGKESCIEQDETHSYSANLILSGPNISPSELSFCSYVWGSVCQEEHTRLAWRTFRKKLDFYSCTVFFEGQAPQSAEYVITSRHDDGKTEPVVVEPLEVKDNFIKMAIRDFGQTGQVGYIRYTI